MQRANLLLLAAGLLIGLGGAELLVRLLDLPPRPLDPLHVGSYRLSDNPILRYEYQPGLVADHAAYDPMHGGLSTNSRGFRDVEFPATKPVNGLRVLALGDSTTAALGVPELWNAWPKRLEQRLREKRRRPVEVLNLGVGGYDPLQEAELLRVRGLELDPDLVLMLVSLNDLQSGVDGGVYVNLLEARRHLDVPRRDLRGVLMRHSRLLFLSVHRLSATPLSAGRHSRPRDSAASPLEEGLALLRRLQDEHGFSAVVFLLPGLDAAYTRYAHRPLHRRMAAIAQGVGGIEWVDLLEGMAESNANLRLLSFDGMHPNRVGQAVVAELIFRELRKRRLP